jgi:hypothetical protein
MVIILIDNLRPSGVVRCKVEDHRLERSRIGLWQAGTSKVVVPRLCRLRTDGLAPVSKY